MYTKFYRHAEAGGLLTSRDLQITPVFISLLNNYVSLHSIERFPSTSGCPPSPVTASTILLSCGCFFPKAFPPIFSLLRYFAGLVHSGKHKTICSCLIILPFIQEMEPEALCFSVVRPSAYACVRACSAVAFYDRLAVDFRFNVNADRTRSACTCRPFCPRANTLVVRFATVFRRAPSAAERCRTGCRRG